MENGAIIDMAPEFRAIHGTAPYRNIQLRMLPVYKKAVADMHAKNKVLIFDVEDIPLHVYAKMHTANEYHWRPKQGKVAGRPLLNRSNCAPGEIPLYSDATKELGIARYQKVKLPTFHEVMLAWDNYRIDANLSWADMWMFKAEGIAQRIRLLHGIPPHVQYNHDNVDVWIHTDGLEYRRRCPQQKCISIVHARSIHFRR